MTKPKKKGRLLKNVRDAITIIGIPTIGIMGWNLHNEQMNIKNYTIESQKVQIEFFKAQRSPVVLEEMDKLNRLMNKEFKRLNDTIQRLRRMKAVDPVLMDKYSDSLEAQLDELENLHSIRSIEADVSVDRLGVELTNLRKKYFGKKSRSIFDQEFNIEEEASIYADDGSVGDELEDRENLKD